MTSEAGPESIKQAQAAGHTYWPYEFWTRYLAEKNISFEEFYQFYRPENLILGVPHE